MPCDFKNAKKLGWKKIPKKFQQMLKITKNSYIFFKNATFQHLLKFFWDFFSTHFFGIFEIPRQLSTFWLRWINYNFQNDWAMAILQKPFCPVRKLKMWRLIIRAPYGHLYRSSFLTLFLSLINCRERVDFIFEFMMHHYNWIFCEMHLGT